MAQSNRSGQDAEEILAYVALAILAAAIALALGAVFAA
jgi:hypothetical protein